MKIQGLLKFNGSNKVTIDGMYLSYKPSLKIINHSPTGFNWGYSGSGPAQLALAILLICTDEANAVKLHQAFKKEFIATQDKDASFELDIDINRWIRLQGGEVVLHNTPPEGLSNVDEDKGGDLSDCTFPEKCQKAEWKQCDCACGGSNHGLQVRMFDREPKKLPSNPRVVLQDEDGNRYCHICGAKTKSMNDKKCEDCKKLIKK